MSGHYDVVVIGGGIIGLSTAMHLLQRHPRLRLAVLEKDGRLAGQQTGHNSGVIHSGIYYRPDSKKAQFCVAGRASIVEFCETSGIPYERCGKVIVATRKEELPRLDSLYERGLANGVEGLEIIEPARLREIEPHVAAIRALWAPSTAIVDFTAIADEYGRRVRESGGEIHLGARVTAIVQRDGVSNIETEDGEYRARFVVNCAGLHADRIAALMGARRDVRIVPFRGEYYTLRQDRQHLVRGLIYPVPDPDLPFLGVHFTRNVKGYVEAGPNAVLATAREGYRKRDVNLRDLFDTLGFAGFWRVARRQWKTGAAEVNRSFRKSVFVRDLQRMIPEVAAGALRPGGSGVRAQAVSRDGALLDDFVIERTDNAVHVLNAPSPGATSSLVIGRHIVALADEAFALE
ncbi:MAG TPA: L-2-hydroxyglutarate oxidase [Dehalococcoidia bacterium]|nr:L-2-hydroxyglutarate oxidase [Dehalococcoidia bacterium]